MRKERHCPTCGVVVWYGIYCSNVCSDKGYAEWLERNKENV